MKRIISGFVLLLIGFSVGVASVVFRFGLNPIELISPPSQISKVVPTPEYTDSNLTVPSLDNRSDNKGNDRYEIVYEGQVGKAFTGVYAILSDLASPVRMEKVEAVFPHKITFLAPRDSSVSSSIDDDEGKTKIYKNGVECEDPPMAVGSAVTETSARYCSR
jgi:hypothetical protein